VAAADHYTEAPPRAGHRGGGIGSSDAVAASVDVAVGMGEDLLTDLVAVPGPSRAT